MYALNKWSEPSMREALAHFREAITRDPRFAPAYAALAEGHVWLYSGIGSVPAAAAVPAAREAVDKAIEIDPALADAHKVRALIAMNHDWDRKGTEQALARALQHGPGSAAVHLWNAWRLVLLERKHDEALAELEEAERLDPLDLQVKTQIGYVHHFRRDVDRAIEQFDRVLALEPSFAFAHYGMGDARAQKGEYDRAIAAFNQAVALQGRSPNHIGVLGYAYGRSGDAVRAKEHLDELEAYATRGHVSPMWTALVHLGLADHERVFECLERAFEDRDGSLILIAAAVEFDPVREDPRFRSLVMRMGLA
jgi:serine/threonine-protein kinase